MGKFLACNELYQAIQQASSEARETLWVSSTNLGADAHKIFSQQIIKNPPSNIRFVFPLNDTTVKRGEINPYEVQYLKERFKDDNVKANDQTYTNIYIFDNTAFLTSAALTEAAFGSNIEAGVMLDGSEAEKIKRFFEENLWQTARPIGDLKKQKTMWNLQQKKAPKDAAKLKIKPHTQLAEWTDEHISTWYGGVLNRLPTRSMQKIREETNWSRELLLVGDVGYKAFKELELGDLIYLANLNSQPGKILMQLVRVHDKSRVETDDGDLHLLGQVQRNYTLEREKYFELLKNLGITSRSVEMKLTDEQLKSMLDVFATIKKRRRRKKVKKSKD